MGQPWDRAVVQNRRTCSPFADCSSSQSRKGPGKDFEKVMPLAAKRSVSPSVKNSNRSPHQENRLPSLVCSPDGRSSACRIAKCSSIVRQTYSGVREVSGFISGNQSRDSANPKHDRSATRKSLKLVGEVGRAWPMRAKHNAEKSADMLAGVESLPIYGQLF